MQLAKAAGPLVIDELGCVTTDRETTHSHKCRSKMQPEGNLEILAKAALPRRW